MVFFRGKQNQKLLRTNRITFSYGLVVIFGCVSVILFTFDHLRLVDYEYSMNRSKREAEFEPTPKQETCLDKFNEGFTNNTSQLAASCRETLEIENHNWSTALPHTTDCIYWCDSKDYPKSMFNIRTRKKGAFAFYRGYFNIRMHSLGPLKSRFFRYSV